MPLITCPECQRAVSDKAAACPSCGAPFRNRRGVVIQGVDIPFGDLVVLIFKATLAAIPAGIILGIVGAVLFGILAGIGASL